MTTNTLSNQFLGSKLHIAGGFVCNGYTAVRNKVVTDSPVLAELVEFYEQLDSKAIFVTPLEAVDTLPPSYVFAPAGLRLDEGQDWSDRIDDLYFVDADLIDLIIGINLVSELSYKCDKSKENIPIVAIFDEGNNLLGFTAGLRIEDCREEVREALRAAMQEDEDNR